MIIEIRFFYLSTFYNLKEINSYTLRQFYQINIPTLNLLRKFLLTIWVRDLSKSCIYTPYLVFGSRVASTTNKSLDNYVPYFISTRIKRKPRKDQMPTFASYCCCCCCLYDDNVLRKNSLWVFGSRKGKKFGKRKATINWSFH